MGMVAAANSKREAANPRARRQIRWTADLLPIYARPNPHRLGTEARRSPPQIETATATTGTTAMVRRSDRLATSTTMVALAWVQDAVAFRRRLPNNPPRPLASGGATPWSRAPAAISEMRATDRC